MVGGGASEPDGQDSGDTAGHRRDRDARRPGHQHQRDADLRAGRLRAGGRSVFRWSRDTGEPRRGSRRRRLGVQRVHQPGRYRRRCAHCGTAGGAAGRQDPSRPAIALRPRRDRQCQADCATPARPLQRIAMGGAGRSRRQPPTTGVGQHQHQESGISRRRLRGGADRSGHGEHDSAGHARRLSRSRTTARQPRRGSGCSMGHHAEAGRGGHRHGGGDRGVVAGGCDAVFGCVR